MKEKSRFRGIVAIMAVIVFSVNSCGDYSGEEQETAKVTVINTSGVKLDLRVFEARNDRTPIKSDISFPTFNKGESTMTVRLYAGESYYVGVWDVESDEAHPDKRIFLCKTNNFTLEKGQTRTFTVSNSYGWSIY